MRKMKKILSVLALTLAVTMMLSTAVFAEDTNNSEDYVVTYSAEEITDIDELIELALEQKAAQPAMFSMEEEESPQLNATQVLEIREYEDGSVEKDMVATAIVPSKEQAIELLADQSGTCYQSSSYVSGYTVSGSFRFTMRTSGGKNTFRFNQLVTIIAKTSSNSTSVSAAYHMYRVDYNPSTGVAQEKFQNINYNNSASTGGQSFTLNSSHSGFYESENDAIAALTYGVGGQTKVDFSNGKYVDLDFQASSDFV